MSVNLEKTGGLCAISAVSSVGNFIISICIHGCLFTTLLVLERAIFYALLSLFPYPLFGFVALPVFSEIPLFTTPFATVFSTLPAYSLVFKTHRRSLSTPAALPFALGTCDD